MDDVDVLATMGREDGGIATFVLPVRNDDGHCTAHGLLIDTQLRNGADQIFERLVGLSVVIVGVERFVFHHVAPYWLHDDHTDI